MNKVILHKRWNISKRSKDQTGASTLAIARLAILQENKVISFPHRLYAYRSLVLSVLL